MDSKKALIDQIMEIERYRQKENAVKLEIRKELQEYYCSKSPVPKEPSDDAKKHVSEIYKTYKLYKPLPPLMDVGNVYQAVILSYQSYTPSMVVNVGCQNDGITTGTFCKTNCDKDIDDPQWPIQINTTACAYGYSPFCSSVADAEIVAYFNLPKQGLPQGVPFRAAVNFNINGLFILAEGPSHYPPYPSGGNGTSNVYLGFSVDALDHGPGVPPERTGGYDPTTWTSYASCRLRASNAYIVQKSGAVNESLTTVQTVGVVFPQDAVPFGGDISGYILRVVMKLEAIAQGAGSVAIGDFGTQNGMIIIPTCWTYPY